MVNIFSLGFYPTNAATQETGPDIDPHYGLKLENRDSKQISESA